MTRTLKITLALSILFLMTALIAIAVGYQGRKMTGFGIAIQCTGEISIIRDNATMNAAITYYMKNRTGLVNIEGYVYDGNQGVSLVSMKRGFLWDANNDFILMYGKPGSLLDTGNTNLALASRFLPDFYLRNMEDNELALRIRRINDQQYFFMAASTPYFICTKTGNGA